MIRCTVPTPVSFAPSAALALVCAAVCVVCAFAPNVALAGDLPDNTRQIPEGYWIGALPTAETIPALEAAGVELIVSIDALDTPTRSAARTAGMELLKFWFGSRFPDPVPLLDAIARYEPEQVYIHCTYGGDRTGAVTAFLLVVEHGWSTEDALLAVVYPSVKDTTRLRELLAERALTVTDDELADAGQYSGARMGGVGGLKVRSDGYRQLVRTTLDEIAGVLEERWRLGPGGSARIDLADARAVGHLNQIGIGLVGL